MCIPDENLTYLFEFCYVKSEIGLPGGIFTSNMIVVEVNVCS